jgi:triosephosphate isomerase
MKIIVANWKLFPKNFKEALNLFELYKKFSSSKKAVFIIAPPILYLQSLLSMYKGRLISFASQTVGEYDEGPHTGSVSARHIKDIGADFVLIGHSEQRKQGLSDKDVSMQINVAVKNNLIPILIVGESVRESNAAYFRFVRQQIKVALKDYPKNKPLKFLIAYEPVWAVGSVKAPKIQEIEMMMIYIRKVLSELFGTRRAKDVALLYGGAVNAHNVRMILDIEQVSGVLLGRVSASPKELKDLYEAL